MTQYLQIHADTPQPRLISQAASILRAGGVIVYPTDSCYAMGALSTDKSAVDRIIRIRRLPPKHNMTMVCRDLADIGTYARLDNTAFRFIKRLTPGPYTFLLKATRDVPRRLQHPQKKTIGLRIPDNRISLRLLESLGEPLLSTSLILPGRDQPETEPSEIRRLLQIQVELIIDGGGGGHVPTTVLDLTGGSPKVVRVGKGDVSKLMTS
jgi:tRNA threonylcarbamoyl adenosine modification protein (Sua5/YciO/YrdC/YwlC family)